MVTDCLTFALAARVNELELQLKSQENDANSVIAQWQETYDGQCTEMNELEAELVSLKQQHELLQNSGEAMSALKAQLTEKEAELNKLQSSTETAGEDAELLKGM